MHVSADAAAAAAAADGATGGSGVAEEVAGRLMVVLDAPGAEALLQQPHLASLADRVLDVWGYARAGPAGEPPRASFAATFLLGRAEVA